MPPNAESFVYLTKGRILMISNVLENEDHNHHALQITLNLEHHPFLIKYPDGETSTECSIIKPNYMHQVTAENTWRALLLIQPEADQTQKIMARYLSKENVITPIPEDIEYCRQQLQGFNKGLLTIEEACNAADSITDRLAGSTPDPVKKDPRIEQVIALIHQANGHDITLNELANKISLSCSRLSHLFSNEIGLPIKRYMLWYKMCQTCFKMFTGTTIAKAALDAGFSDAAHYTRACRQMLGMTPSQLVRESHIVKLASDISHG